MALEASLEPYAAQVKWAAEAPFSSNEWLELLASFVEAVARRTVDLGAVLVGHIKGVARPEGGGFLHVSVVSASRPASVQGQVTDGLRVLSFDLNVLVYGLPRNLVEAVVREIAQENASSRRVSVEVAPAPSRVRFQGLHVPESGR